MTRLWSAGLALWLAVFAAPALAQLTPPAAETPAPPPVTADPKVLDAAGRAAAPDTAAAAPTADRAARYQFVRVGDTILKLDGDSGEVSLCKASGGGWSCQALPENRVALEKQIGELRQTFDKEIGDLKSMLTAQDARSQRDIENLKDELKAVKLAAAPPPPPPPPAQPERTGIDLRWPNAQDYDRARAVVEDAWRRFVAATAQVQSDVMRRF